MPKAKVSSGRLLVDMVPVIRSHARGLVDGLTFSAIPVESLSDDQLEEQLKFAAISFSIGEDLCNALVSDVDDDDPAAADAAMIAARVRQQPNDEQLRAFAKINQGIRELRAATAKRFKTRTRTRRAKKDDSR